MKKGYNRTEIYFSGQLMPQLKWVVAAMLLTLLLPGCRKSSKSPMGSGVAPGSQAITVEGVVAKVSPISQTITVSGTLKPFEETTLMPEVNGRVIRIYLPEGRFVKAGTLLVKLFDDDLQAQLKKYQTQLEISSQTLERQSELLKVNGISQSDYDQTRLQVASINNDIALVKAQIRKTEVVAPYDGIIGLKNISIGAQVAPSTPLAIIREQDKLKLDFSIPEKYSVSIREGTEIKFTVQGSDKIFDAVVSATEQGIDEDTRNLRARAIVSKRDASLIPGSFASVVLTLGENLKAIMLPTQCIIPQERNKSVITIVSGKAKFVTVETGTRRESDIEILKGINPGDTIVSTGIMFIKPGAPVKFSRIQN